jgi:hypothetical protein
MFDGRAALRLLVGFLVGLAFWFLFSSTYEKLVASAAELILRLAESPAVTRIDAPGREFIVHRSDFPPSSHLPGLPAPDLHFNFVLMVALFALNRHPFRGDGVRRFLLAMVCLFAVHVAAVVFQIERVYAMDLGAWSPAHYGAAARNFWAGGFHFYQIAGRFAAPFAIWWLIGRGEPEEKPGKPESPRRRKKKGRDR